MFSLSFGSTRNMAFNNFLIFLSYSGSNYGTFPLYILPNNFTWVFPWNGGSRAHSSYKSTPRDQISDLKLYAWPKVSSGEKYSGVPTPELARDLVLERTREIPKSANLVLPSVFSKMLAALISLCKILRSWQCLTASTIYANQSKICFSSK